MLFDPFAFGLYEGITWTIVKSNVKCIRKEQWDEQSLSGSPYFARRSWSQNERRSRGSIWNSRRSEMRQAIHLEIIHTYIHYTYTLCTCIREALDAATMASVTIARDGKSEEEKKPKERFVYFFWWPEGRDAVWRIF